MANTQAAVIGSSIVSFLPGLDRQQCDAVKTAVALAERATLSVFNEGLVEDWLSYFRNQLKFMGWDAVAPEDIHWPTDQRSKLVDKALQTIAATAGEHFAKSTDLALRRLMASPATLGTFERQAAERQCLQFLPCSPAGNGRVDMVLYFETDKKTRFATGFMERKRSYQKVSAELVRFNVRAFMDTHLPKVLARTVEQARLSIHEYQI
ncbi:hypothetical protein CXQ80_02215 [Pseudomonas sp. 02C 26]|uniref:hypothetical protein n=1 Tax=Pseudomonas sp. 02C 26 TaxID=2054914 RepID=UPI000C6D5740|nr:hypothetical protein [Pseudomonas sp. 02C 26]AUF94722.1 hypothetical protein CXQ80_02215 [Pseudomonas sp. 02C 26]